ncbi:MAG: site-2 protease family protein [Clostridia bacterium]|nr:site-2 protease family protein [Clostridia bacterium]
MINNLLSFASVMKSIGGVLLAIVILLAMVTVHEFGHYVAGKLLNFKINEFSVGFGPAIWKKRSKKTGELFALRAIPLGGYCAFDGEDELMEEAESKTTERENGEEPFDELTGDVNLASEEKDEGMYEMNGENSEESYPEPKGERFNDQAPWKRIIVLIAGATMNYLLALLVIICMFAFVGRPVYKIAERMENSLENVGVETLVDELLVGDVVTEIEGKNVYMITDYMDILDGKKKGDTVTFTVIRDGKETEAKLALKADADIANLSDVSTLLVSMGVQSMYAVSLSEGFFETIGNSLAYSVKIGGSVLRSLGELLTGKLGIESMGGPITTIKVTSEAASSGISSFLNITAFIGVNLAVFNLLPVPALDGCKVIFCLIEWIRKKPVNRKVEGIINLIGIAVLFGFAILVDLLQIF